MKTTSIQLPEDMKNDLKGLAKKTGKSQSDLVREFVALGIKRHAQNLSLADRLRDMEGHFEGPKDLSRRKAFEG